MEFLDIVDEQDRVVGVLPIGAAHEQKKRHRTAGILLFSDATHKTVLLQHRSKHHMLSPNTWSFISGHVKSGSTYLATALEEFHEEMFYGLPAPTIALTHLFKIRKNEDNDPEFLTVFSGVHTGPFVIDEHEVQGWRWIHVDDLDREIAAYPERFAGTFVRVWTEYRMRYPNT